MASPNGARVRLAPIAALPAVDFLKLAIIAATADHARHRSRSGSAFAWITATVKKLMLIGLAGQTLQARDGLRRRNAGPWLRSRSSRGRRHLATAAASSTVPNPAIGASTIGCSISKQFDETVGRATFSRLLPGSRRTSRRRHEGDLLPGDECRLLQIHHGVGDLLHLTHLRPIGCNRLRKSCASGECIGVLIAPGETAFTRTFRLAYSIASERVIALSSAFGQRRKRGRQ